MTRTIPHPYIPGCCRVVHDGPQLKRPHGYSDPDTDERNEDDEPTWDEIAYHEWRDEMNVRNQRS